MPGVGHQAGQAVELADHQGVAGPAGGQRLAQPGSGPVGAGRAPEVEAGLGCSAMLGPRINPYGQLVASFDDLSLDLTVPGALLRLRDVADTAWTETLADGITGRLSAGSRGVVVENLPVLPHEGLRQAGRDAANRVLDLIAIRSAGSYALADPTTPALSWQLTAAGTELRVAFEVGSTFSLRVGGEPAPYPLTWHPSMRYFRMSQTTTDLYDAFRNVYLALESLLADIEPVIVKANGKSEGEGVWALRALQAAETLLQAQNPPRSLRAYLPAGATVADPAQDVKDELYSGTRTLVFHAKSGRPVALPQVLAEQTRILNVLSRYARMYTDLAELRIGARFLRSGPSDYAVQQMTDTQMLNWQLGVSARDFPTITDFEQDGGSALVGLPTRRARELDGPRGAAVLGEADTAGLGLPAQLLSVGARSTGGDPVCYDNLAGVLDLEGVNRAQVELCWQIGSAGTKTAYDS